MLTVWTVQDPQHHYELEGTFEIAADLAEYGEDTLVEIAGRFAKLPENAYALDGVARRFNGQGAATTERLLVAADTHRDWYADHPAETPYIAWQPTAVAILATRNGLISFPVHPALPNLIP